VCCRFEIRQLSFATGVNEICMAKCFYLLGEKVFACLDSSARHICLLNGVLSRAENATVMRAKVIC